MHSVKLQNYICTMYTLYATCTGVYMYVCTCMTCVLSEVAMNIYMYRMGDMEMCVEEGRGKGE